MYLPTFFTVASSALGKTRNVNDMGKINLHETKDNILQSVDVLLRKYKIYPLHQHSQKKNLLSESRPFVGKSQYFNGINCGPMLAIAFLCWPKPPSWCVFMKALTLIYRYCSIFSSVHENIKLTILIWSIIWIITSQKKKQQKIWNLEFFWLYNQD